MPENNLSKRIEKILETLCVDIGIRLAGSEADHRTVEFLQKELSGFGAEVTVEQFPVLERRVEEEKLEVRIGDNWQTFGCSLFGSTPGTEGSWLKAPCPPSTWPTRMPGDGKWRVPSRREPQLKEACRTAYPTT